MENTPCKTQIKTPKLVIVQRSRRISKPSEEAVKKGDELLNDLIQFADSIKERQEAHYIPKDQIFKNISAILDGFKLQHEAGKRV